MRSVDLRAAALRLAVLALFWPCFALQAAAAGPATALPSVVSLLPLWRGLPPDSEEPEGSAVAIATTEGATLLLTADHVLGNAEDFRVRTAEGVAYPARLVGRDRASDLALLRVPVVLTPLEQADAPAPGAPVCAIGNAFGLGLSISCGVLSARERAGVGFNPIEDFLQSDAAVNPGMSGGALVDGEGRLVGLLSAIFTKGSDADIGVNFAVSTALIRTALPDLRAGVPVAWPMVDLSFRPLPPEAEGPLGPLVARVPPGGAAASAGLQAGDRILQAGPRRIRNPGDWRVAIALSTPGASLALAVWRQGAREALQLVVPGR